MLLYDYLIIITLVLLSMMNIFINMRKTNEFIMDSLSPINVLHYFIRHKIAKQAIGDLD